MLASLLLLATGPSPEPEATLIVKMRKFRNDEGKALVALFDSADGYPMKSGKARALTKVSISKKGATARFKGLTPGEYATSNAQLVEKIVRIARELGRDIASADEAREIIGIKKK